MSGPDSPDPFGRRDRTIVVPDPGGRRRAAAGAPAPFPVAPGYQGEGEFGGEPPRSRTDPFGAPASPPPASPSPASSSASDRGSVFLQIPPPKVPGDNPLLQAASPLLMLLGRLNAEPSQVPLGQMLPEVTGLITAFDAEAKAAGVPEAQVRLATYALCATADDIAQNTPSAERHVWTQHSTLSRFFGERVGGVRFFEDLERAKSDPIVNYPLLEVYHACLALGFKGIHRTSAGGEAALQGVRRNLYETLRRVRAPVQDLSPQWQGQEIRIEARRLRVPVWVVVAVAGVGLLSLFLALRILLGGRAEAVAEELLAASPRTAVMVQRQQLVAPPPRLPAPAPSSRLVRVRSALGKEIAAGTVEVAQAGDQIVVRLARLALFPSASAAVSAEFLPLLKQIAAVLAAEPGEVKVVGHTDSLPIKAVRFASNHALSLARAQAVGRVLVENGIAPPERVKVDGRGADRPVASNKTPEGRAANRRVEILIPGGD